MRVREKIVAGNWKMNGSTARIHHLLEPLVAAWKQQAASPKATVVVMPPAIYIPLVSQLVAGTGLQVGAQNIYPRDAGAYTGEIAPPMLQDFACRYVLVGHSERRALFHEDEKFVAEKFHHVKEHGMIPVLCVGETLESREKGLTEQIISRQLNAIADNTPSAFKKAVVAYEPVWAIGTGKTATPLQAQDVHAFIRAEIAKINKDDADVLPILYGGSVNETNAAALFAMRDVDGALVGGASLNAEQFLEIIKCIN